MFLFSLVALCPLDQLITYLCKSFARSILYFTFLYQPRPTPSPSPPSNPPPPPPPPPQHTHHTHTHLNNNYTFLVVCLSFYAKNNFGIVHFSLFVIDALKYIFEAIIFIHAAIIHKIKLFLKIFIREISNMSLILYFSHIFYFERCLSKKYHGILFLK